MAPGSAGDEFRGPRRQRRPARRRASLRQPHRPCRRALTPHPEAADIFAKPAAAWQKLFESRTDSFLTGHAFTLASGFLPGTDDAAHRHALLPAPHP